MNDEQLCQYLTDHQISFLRFEHPPVFTCEEAARELSDAPGTATKNLLLVDNESNQFFLLVVKENKRIHFKKLAKILDVRKLRFASANDLNQYLGVEEGAVTLLGVINDGSQRIKVILDQDLQVVQALQCHPLVNTATLVLAREAVDRFLSIVNHPPVYISGFSNPEESTGNKDG